MLSTVRIYFSLFFSSSGHVYLQLLEIKISRNLTCKVERCFFNVFNGGITVKIFELSRICYFWISFQRIMFMSNIDKTVVRNAKIQDPIVRYYIRFISKYEIY